MDTLDPVVRARLWPTDCSRTNQFDLWEIGFVAPRISGQQLVAIGLGMGANEKVGQNAGFGAAAVAVSPERMGGQLRGWLG